MFSNLFNTGHKIELDDFLQTHNLKIDSLLHVLCEGDEEEYGHYRSAVEKSLQKHLNRDGAEGFDEFWNQKRHLFRVVNEVANAMIKYSSKDFSHLNKLKKMAARKNSKVASAIETRSDAAVLALKTSFRRIVLNAPKMFYPETILALKVNLERQLGNSNSNSAQALLKRVQGLLEQNPQDRPYSISLNLNGNTDLEEPAHIEGKATFNKAVTNGAANNNAVVVNSESPEALLAELQSILDAEESFKHIMAGDVAELEAKYPALQSQLDAETLNFEEAHKLYCTVRKNGQTSLQKKRSWLEQQEKEENHVGFYYLDEQRLMVIKKESSYCCPELKDIDGETRIRPASLMTHDVDELVKKLEEDEKALRLKDAIIVLRREIIALGVEQKELSIRQERMRHNITVLQTASAKLMERGGEIEEIIDNDLSNYAALLENSQNEVIFTIDK